jgi:hypothetical protein
LIFRSGTEDKHIQFKLSSRSGIEWIPSIRFLNGPRYPVTYPGQRKPDSNNISSP